MGRTLRDLRIRSIPYQTRHNVHSFDSLKRGALAYVGCILSAVPPNNRFLYSETLLVLRIRFNTWRWRTVPTEESPVRNVFVFVFNE